MKRKWNKFFAFVLYFITVVMLSSGTKTVQAATVSKVSGTVKSYYNSKSGYKQYTLLTGKAKSGKKVWTYKTKKCPAVAGRSASWTVKGASVYIIDDKTFVRLNKQTGEVMAKKKSKYLNGWAGVIVADGSGNSYSIGKYAPYVVKLNKSGKVKWKCNISRYSSYGFAVKIALSGSKLTVRFDDGTRLVMNPGNGRIIRCIK